MLRRLYYWWMEKVLDRHVCKEFTQWKEEVRKYKVYATLEEIAYGASATETRTMTRRYQSRRCTICGKVYQEELEL